MVNNLSNLSLRAVAKSDIMYWIYRGCIIKSKSTVEVPVSFRQCKGRENSEYAFYAKLCQMNSA